MADLVSGNAAIGQSGGPTAVINQSLAGVIEGLKAGLAASGADVAARQRCDTRTVAKEVQCDPLAREDRAE